MAYTTRKRNRELEALGVVETNVVDELRKEVASLKEEIEHMKASIPLLSMSVNNSQPNLDHVKAEISELRARLDAKPMDPPECPLKKRVDELSSFLTMKQEFILEEIKELKTRMDAKPMDPPAFPFEKQVDEIAALIAKKQESLLEEVKELKARMDAKPLDPPAFMLEKQVEEQVSSLSKKQDNLFDAIKTSNTRLSEFVEQTNRSVSQCISDIKQQRDYTTTVVAQLSSNNDKMIRRIDDILRSIVDMRRYIPAYQVMDVDNSQRMS